MVKLQHIQKKGIYNITIPMRIAIDKGWAKGSIIDYLLNDRGRLELFENKTGFKIQYSNTSKRYFVTVPKVKVKAMNWASGQELALTYNERGHVELVEVVK